MLLGFDGTVGGFDSLIDAAGRVYTERLRRIWQALNEPIPFPGLSGGLVGAASAIGMQAGKVGQGAVQGSVGSVQIQQEAVQAEFRLLEQMGFVNQFARNYARLRGGPAFYLHGPTTLGTQNEEIIERGVEAVLSRRRDGEELIVVGYSRGGLNAINACNRLGRRAKRPIDLLILLDPVDRDGEHGACDVSAAVRNCILAQRGGNWITWKPCTVEYKVMGTAIRVPDVWLTNSRWWFGRMVDGSDAATLTHGALAHETFDASHAAFGGVPWTGDNPRYMNQDSDRGYAQTIARFINAQVERFVGWAPGLSLIQPPVR